MNARRAACAAIAIALLGCDPSPASPDAGAGTDGGPREDDAGALIDAGSDAGALLANAGPSIYAVVGEEVVLDGSASVNAVSYQWAPSGGLPVGAISNEPTARVVYERPGRHSAVLTVRDAAGNRRSDNVVVSAVLPAVHEPRHSSSVAVIGDHQVAVVSPDADELTFARWTDAGALTVERRVATCDDPRSVAAWRDGAVVTCRGDSTIAWVPPTGAVVRLALHPGALPFGATGRNDGPLWVALQGTGELAEITMTGGELELVRTMPAVADARGVSLLPDDRVAVTRWRSPDDGGQIVAIDTSTGDRETWTLAVDPQASSDTEIGGVPTYLEQLVVSPDGTRAIVASTQAAIGEGLFVTDGARPLTFETAVRAVVSVLDPADGTDVVARRQLDNRGLANAAAITSRGDYAFVATRGAQSVERLDLLSGARQSGSIQHVGFAPNGVVLSPDDRFLFVDAFLSRELVMYDVRDFTSEPVALARAPISDGEPLEPDVALGKRLFYDSHDPRMGRDGYLTCGSCHLDGLADGRTWDFTDRGEGLRNTTALLGIARTGAIHWSANFDELQDFENDIRGGFGGTGLMSDADFHTGTRAQTLGDSKAGVSDDLDALAAYVASLERNVRSPWRDADGALPAAAVRGRALFESTALGCTSCHAGDELTDSGFASPGVPRLHDVGTFGAGSGQRMHATLTGLDTPSLHGLFESGPYLHDGSAATLRDVLTTRNASDEHGVTSGLDAGELDDLVAYLLCLDGS